MQHRERIVMMHMPMPATREGVPAVREMKLHRDGRAYTVRRRASSCPGRGRCWLRSQSLHRIEAWSRGSVGAAGRAVITADWVLLTGRDVEATSVDGSLLLLAGPEPLRTGRWQLLAGPRVAAIGAVLCVPRPNRRRCVSAVFVAGRAETYAGARPGDAAPHCCMCSQSGPVFAGRPVSTGWAGLDWLGRSRLAGPVSTGWDVVAAVMPRPRSN